MNYKEWGASIDKVSYMYNVHNVCTMYIPYAPTFILFLSHMHPWCYCIVTTKIENSSFKLLYMYGIYLLYNAVVITG